MTICIAAICAFNFGTNDDPSYGSAIITASDRLLSDTGLGIDYEPGQGKYAFASGRVTIFVADDVTVHSLLLARLRDTVAGMADPTVFDVANAYSKLIANFKNEIGEFKYLSPLGMNSEAFRQDQTLMNSSVGRGLAEDMLAVRVPAEAIVVGADSDGRCHIYSVNDSEPPRCHDDIGFVAIGSGHVPAVAHLMSAAYWNKFVYYDCMQTVHRAKKRAETAGGVGKNTDMFLIHKDGRWILPRGTIDHMDKEYAKFLKSVRKLEQSSAIRLGVENLRQWQILSGEEQATAPKPQSPQDSTDDPSPPPA